MYCLLILFNTSTSNMVHSMPSSIPICEPIPNERSITKNNIAQKGARGNRTIASVNTMNASPVPSAACNKVNVSNLIY